MNRLTSVRNSHGEKRPSTSASFSTLVRRNLIKTPTPVAPSFGRGYGLLQATTRGNLLSQPANATTILIRELSTKMTKMEREIAEENLKPQNMKISKKESLEDIRDGLVKLTEKEIQGILDRDAQSLDTERGRTWLEESQYKLADDPKSDVFLLTKSMNGTSVVVSFKKDISEEPEEEDMDDAMEEGEGEGEGEGAQEESTPENKEEGNDWIRSGDELPGDGNIKTVSKHNLEVDIKVEDKKGKVQGKLKFYGFAGLDDRLYINHLDCFEGEAEAETKKLTFDDLSDGMQDRMYDYLDELGVDDRMAYFIKTTVAREAKQKEIRFLNVFKNVIRP